VLFLLIDVGDSLVLMSGACEGFSCVVPLVFVRDSLVFRCQGFSCVVPLVFVRDSLVFRCQGFSCRVIPFDPVIGPLADPTVIYTLSTPNRELLADLQ
jgi:hypothetical protein